MKPPIATVEQLCYARDPVTLSRDYFLSITLQIQLSICNFIFTESSFRACPALAPLNAINLNQTRHLKKKLASLECSYCRIALLHYRSTRDIFFINYCTNIIVNLRALVFQLFRIQLWNSSVKLSRFFYQLFTLRIQLLKFTYSEKATKFMNFNLIVCVLAILSRYIFKIQWSVMSQITRHSRIFCTN